MDPIGSSPPAFHITLTLLLPRDRLSVPVTRHLVGTAMREIGVVREDTEAVELALSEACTNVVTHSGPGDAYQVTITLVAGRCEIRVVDVGRGFDHESLGAAMADVDAEHGRGVGLMRALVDRLAFESQPEDGTVVHLVKDLRFDDAVPTRRMMGVGSGGDGHRQLP